MAFIITCKAPKRGWSHIMYVQVCIRGRKGDDDAIVSSIHRFLLYSKKVTHR